MFSPGRIQALIDSGVIQRVLDDAGMQKNTDPQYQQPAGPNSVTPQTNSALMNAGIQAGLDYTPAGGGSGGGISGSLNKAVELANQLSPGPVNPGAGAAGGALVGATAGALPGAAEGALPTPGVYAGGGILPTPVTPTRFNPVTPGSQTLGQLFEAMKMQRFQPQQDQVKPSQVSPGQAMYSATDLLRTQSPFVAAPQTQGRQTVVDQFLRKGVADRGGIADLLRAYGQ